MEFSFNMRFGASWKKETCYYLISSLYGNGSLEWENELISLFVFSHFLLRVCQ
jgi:hypothetical protein